MKGFGRHTSKVIAYLRDQVAAGPLIPRYRIVAVAWVSHGKKENAALLPPPAPAFRDVIKTVVSGRATVLNYR